MKRLRKLTAESKIKYEDFKNAILKTVYDRHVYERDADADTNEITITMKYSMHYKKEEFEKFFNTEISNEEWASLCNQFVEDSTFSDLNGLNKFFADRHSNPEVDLCEDLYQYDSFYVAMEDLLSKEDYDKFMDNHEDICVLDCDSKSNFDENNLYYNCEYVTGGR